jgi:hypothetical protein
MNSTILSTIRLTPAGLYKFFTRWNLNMHIRYYNAHRLLVMKEIEAISLELESKEITPERRRDLVLEKSEIVNSYYTYIIINTFLMMYSHLEECLALNLRAPVTTLRTLTGLDGFKREFKSRYSINLAQAPHWAFLKDCSQLRNTLLHVAGNMTLADGRKLNPVMKRNRRYVHLKNRRLVLREELLRKLGVVIPAFVDWLDDKTRKKPND